MSENFNKRSLFIRLIISINHICKQERAIYDVQMNNANDKDSKKIWVFKNSWEVGHLQNYLTCI